MKISEHFKLNKTQQELDFVDIDYNGDTPLFLDPYFISKRTSEITEEGLESIQSFFKLLIIYLKTNQLDETIQLMEHVGEINDIHLGLSKNKSQGKGIGKDDTLRLIESLKNSKALETGLIENLEDCRLFIDNIGKDKISDLCANLIKKQLIDYTIDQCNLWNIPLQEAPSGFYWDSISRKWTQDLKCKRLIIDGKPILLVPKEFVSYSNAYCTEKYIQHFVLNFYQNEHLRLDTALVKKKVDKKGNVIDRWVTKKSIKEDFALNGVVINKAWLVEFSTKHPEILDEYRKNAKIDNFDVFGDDVTPEKLNGIIDSIITKLQSIPEGRNHASDYHNLILGACEFLFYPTLTNPKKEFEINEGRKRIDIVFSNTAKIGLFKTMCGKYKIPLRLLMIECKNYNKEIANPELDQMAGRLCYDRGMFGIIFCRHLDNEELFVKREQDSYRDESKIIIHITDERLIQLLNAYKDFFDDSYEKIIAKWVKEVCEF